jgi:mono/diheme cytochrome c family protein
MLAAILASAPPSHAQSRIPLHRARQHKSDLELGGQLAGVPHGQTRFVTYADLLKLPQETYTVLDDSNFTGPVRISGIAVEKLPALLDAARSARMITAICDDLYAAHYPSSYLAAHHPILVLRINNRDPGHWPLGADHAAMGPYLISHPSFKPAFRVLAHYDEAQVPWGVVRLDFDRESQVYAPILPSGPTANDGPVEFGFAIARQNCFRCHNAGAEGGHKAKRTWQSIARVSVEQPDYFDAYILHPTQLEPASQMAPSPQYDAETLAALRAYFKPFAEIAP